MRFQTSVVLPVLLVLVVCVVASGRGTRAASAEHAFTGLKVRFQTTDVNSTIRFYRDVLGLQIVDQWSDDCDVGVIFGLEGAAGTAFLEFGQVSSPDTPHNGGASIQLRIGDMAAFLARLGDRWAVDGPHERPWGSVYTYLRDPNGVQVIVYTGAV